MKKYNLLLDVDSYKVSMFKQYPPGTEYVFSYVEARGGDTDKILFFGLRYYLEEYLSKPITREDIDEAEEIFSQHGVPFNKEGWEYILEKYNGYLPVVIRAVPEGTVIGLSNVLLTIQNSDPKCFWLTTYLETSLLRICWYGTTVATTSWKIKRLIKKHLEYTADSIDSLDFRLHDFGARGVSSYESSMIGGAAHLINFKGSDTVAGIRMLRDYYNGGVCGFSIPASEHSTITSWGKDNEVESYRNLLNQFGQSGKVFACVSDSYDIFNACEKLWGGELKDEVVNSGATIVIRPDSGNPATVVLNCLDILSEKFGYTINSKGYKVLNYVRVIQGDGINEDSINDILSLINSHQYSAENVYFGMGGALLQHVNRDTYQFAMKCSAIRVNGEWRDVYKDPVTSAAKQSKRGKLDLIKNGNDFETVREGNSIASELELVFAGGAIYSSDTLETIRNRVIV